MIFISLKNYTNGVIILLMFKSNKLGTIINNHIHYMIVRDCFRYISYIWTARRPSKYEPYSFLGVWFFLCPKVVWVDEGIGNDLKDTLVGFSHIYPFFMRKNNKEVCNGRSKT